MSLTVFFYSRGFSPILSLIWVQNSTVSRTDIRNWPWRGVSGGKHLSVSKGMGLSVVYADFS